jgi:hypothetical protein
MQKKKHFYIKPESNVLLCETEAFIAASPNMDASTGTQDESENTYIDTGSDENSTDDF